MSDSKSESYLSANFGNAGGHMSWGSHDEAITWINAQISDWQWLAQQGLNAANNALNFIHQQHLIPARDCLNQALQYPSNPDQIKNFLNAAISHLERLYSTNAWLLPNSPHRKFIFEIRDSGKAQEAGLITAYLLNQDLNNSPLNKVIPALLELELFNRGSKDRVKAEGTALKNLVGQMTTALTEHKELQVNQTAAFANLNEDFSKQATERSTEFDTSQTQRDEQWLEHIKKSNEELKNIAAAYDAHMQLAAPVAYWESKRKKHQWFSVISFLSIVACMFLFGCELLTQISGRDSYIGIGKATNQNSVNSNANKVELNIEKTDTAKAANLSINKASQSATTAQSSLDYFVQSKIGAYILLVTLAFWFIRILVRLFLSSIHLENDAAERVTMAKTYQALIRDGSFERKENIGTILAALFRPTGDGIVKDEGLPPTAMEWLTKLSGKN